MCSLMPLLIDEMQLLPWGGKITSESLRFFSPVVVWTIFEPTEANHQVLYSAFMDYYKVCTFCLSHSFSMLSTSSECSRAPGMQVWLELVDEAVRETSKEKIDLNREAQHKYLTWRAEKVRSSTEFVPRSKRLL